VSSPEAGGRLRILLVDDHPVVRAGLRALLDGHADLEVVGDAGDAVEAVRMAERLRPALVLMDLQMGGELAGLEAIRHIAALPRPPRVVVLTTYDSDADFARAVEAGAAGYLLKESPPDQLLQALRTAARGETVLSPPLASRMMRRMRTPQTAPSPREIEILQLLADGQTNREISRTLFISEATVKTHLAHLYDKLAVDNRTEAVRVAVARRLIRLP
jgi:DNA-binding NarL/FixJ family response regulator